LEESWRFGPYALSPARRRLECDGSEVALGARSFELLVMLVRHAGEVVGKAELLAQVWGGIVVDESSLRVHMSMLRKALSAAPDDGGEWIVNVPSRGYSFRGRVDAVEYPEHPLPSAAVGVERLPLRQAPGQMPRGVRLVGRADEVARIGALLGKAPLVSVVGPGGMGKTAVAIAVARRWSFDARGSVVFVDLAPAFSHGQLLAALGAALGVGVDLHGSVDSLRARLDQRPTLLVLDNCEQVLDALAPVIDALWEGTDGLAVLATSREPLRVPGEAVVRLGALAAPLPLPGMSRAETLAYPAVELFAARAAAAGAHSFDDSHAARLAVVCQQLDGIPLALELVAARLGVLTLADLAARLDEHMQLRSDGGRAVLARHQTMAAALDWSLALLDAAERCLLRRLAVFRGAFDLESALRMAGDIDADAAFEALSALVAKSLVILEPNGGAAPYRLLGITRAWALRLLEQAGEGAASLRCHAVWVLDLLSASLADLPALSSAQWEGRYGHLLPDVRAAIDWAESAAAGPDEALAVDLATASAALWFHRSQVAEYRDHLLRALGRQQGRPGCAGAVNQLRLALGNTLWHTEPNAERMLALFQQAAGDVGEAAAPSYGERWPLVHARWGMCVARVSAGDYPAALADAEAVALLAFAGGSPPVRQLAHRVGALASHFAGRFAQSRESGYRALAALPSRRPARLMLQVDGGVAAHAIMARTLWISGRQQAALESGARAFAEAQASGHALSLCFALFGVCPVLLWSGEYARANAYVELMLEETERRDLRYWHGWARCYAFGLEMQADRSEGLRIAVAEWGRGMTLPHREMLATFHPETVDAVLLKEIEARGGGWADAEILRGMALHTAAGGNGARADALLLRAIALARAQGALAWEMRAALSLARLRMGVGDRDGAAALLEAPCAALLPGEEGREARCARALLENLRDATCPDWVAPEWGSGGTH
jgi:predicted ATPase/DNA-binding winged helix-turn-helix (wHTH) protein